MTPLSQTDQFQTAYRRLVDARLGYEDLRHAGASRAAIVDARAVLHRARAEMASVRRSDVV
jgi:hypothetical protein